MRPALPCPLSDYRGTKWHRRLVLGEFAVLMDGAPAREIVEDATLRRVEPSDLRMQAYRSFARELFSREGAAWDGLGPFDLLDEMREARSRLFGADEVDLSCLRSPYDPAEAAAEAAEEAAVRLRASSSREWLVVPDQDDPESSERLAAAARARFGPPSGGAEPVLIVGAPASTEAEALREAARGRAVFCADLRFAFAFLRAAVPFAALLDGRDWYSALLLGENRDGDDGIAFPASSAYGGILEPAPAARRGFRWRDFPAAERPRTFYSGAAAPLPRDASLPPGFSGLEADGSIKLFSASCARRGDGTWGKLEKAEPGSVHVAAVVADGKAAQLDPLFLDAQASPASFRGGPSVLAGFAYYLTDSLVRWYGERDPRPLPWRRPVIDYLYLPDRGFESFPLYRKAVLGRTKAGRLFSFAGEPRAIVLRGAAGRAAMVFDGASLRAETERGGRAELHLPRNGRRAVGEGRACATFFHDCVLDVRTGPVEVPPFGCVVVEDEASFLPGEACRWDVAWDGLPVPKEEVAWMVGGFNALVRAGEDLCATDSDAAGELAREGWDEPLSRLTQETQLESGVRQPRCCVGATAGGRIVLLVASGRHPESAGATFADLPALARLALEEAAPGDRLDFLTNLDGGASASLYAFDGEGGRALGVPSPSDCNASGIPRKVPALLRLAFPGSERREERAFLAPRAPRT